jgi:hypothetical protein
MSKLNLNINLKAYEGENTNTTNSIFGKTLQHIGISIENHICQEVKVEASSTKTLFEVSPAEAKSFVYIDSIKSCDIIINDTQQVTLNPIIANGSTRKGVFLNTNSVEKLQIQNNSLEDIDIYLITAK